MQGHSTEVAVSTGQDHRGFIPLKLDRSVMDFHPPYRLCVKEVIPCRGFADMEGRRPSERYTASRRNGLPGPGNVPVVEDRLRSWIR